MERITLLGHVAIEVLFGPEAAEEVLGLAATYTTSLVFKKTSFNQPQLGFY